MGTLTQTFVKTNIKSKVHQTYYDKLRYVRSCYDCSYMKYYKKDEKSKKLSYCTRYELTLQTGSYKGDIRPLLGCDMFD